MAIIIDKLKIDSFRGIQELEVPKLNHVNIILGDNNCGKTSVLEALLLLRNPGSITNLIRIAGMRDNSVQRVSIYENFINLFMKNESMMKLGIEATVKSEPISCGVNGTENRVFLDERNIEATEAHAFQGAIYVSDNTHSFQKKVYIHEFSAFKGMEIDEKEMIKMQYLSPLDHLKGNVINRIIRNDGYKELCVRILQMFDPDILDILILKNEKSGFPVEYIKHRRLGNMPVSTYGDGIKKVLSLANAIAQADEGILLVDEVETAIHSRYYETIFNFLVMACKQFNVQLFITTHSIEAVDGLLDTQNYDEQNDVDEIGVITLKKGENKTYSRILSGRQVYNDRESFGFEVRL